MPAASAPASPPGELTVALLPAELEDARRHAPRGSADDHEAFARRQGAALARLDALESFYAAHDCRMARLHRLGGAVAVLNRFPGASAAFERIGHLLQPVDENGQPRGPRWAAYATACRLGRALDVRDELWISAHAADLRDVRAEGLEAAFVREAAEHPHDPAWQLMHRHFEFTLGARQLDEPALAGAIALETAMADAMGHSVSRMLRDGASTFRKTFVSGLRALFAGRPTRPGVPSYRHVALLVARGVFAALASVSVWRKGLREAGRGESATAASWPILAQTLGDRVRDVHPLVVGFYDNPAHYDVRCTLELFTAPARFWSWMLTLVAGQGLYEAGPRTLEARIRTYRRSDGSMHFVREIDTGHALRVFDSDFLVRPHRGVPTLFERFSEAHLEYELMVTPLGPGLGVSIRGRDLYWRGWRMPSTGLEVEFRSAVDETPEGSVLRLEGVLALRPRSKTGRFVAYRVMRRPEILGRIRYVARPRAAVAGEGSWPFLA